MKRVHRCDISTLGSNDLVYFRRQIASQELGIVAYRRRNLLTASIPVHRRDVHLKKSVLFDYPALDKSHTGSGFSPKDIKSASSNRWRLRHSKKPAKLGTRSLNES